MREKTSTLIKLNPTIKQDSSLLFSVFTQFHFVQEYRLEHLTTSDTNEPTKFYLTHPFFCFVKPERTGKDGRTKPKQDYFAVYDPKFIGKGAYGAAYPVIGTWHQAEQGWVFKSKSDPNKQRLVKSNIDMPFRTGVSKVYIQEQKIGRYAPHMGMQYKPTIYHRTAFLLMRYHKGIDLEHFLELHGHSYSLPISRRFVISINLLKRVKTQVFDLTFPPKYKKRRLIHRDLKPSNIILRGLAPEIIDFGLAKKKSMIISIAGTLVYIDPMVLAHNKDTQDYLSDLFSVFRVIAEVWGDQSADDVYDLAQTNYRNQHLQFKGLFNNLELSEQQRIALTDLLTKANVFDEKQRLSRGVVSKSFKKLYLEHLERNRTLATETPLRQLSTSMLIDLLCYPTAPILIKRFKKSPQDFPFIFTKLSSSLLYLDDLVLIKLQRAGLDFRKRSKLLLRVLKSSFVTEAKLELLIKFGTPLRKEHLHYWLNNVKYKGRELEWAAICRLLYRNLNAIDPDDLKADDPFKKLFCQYFLVDPASAATDEHNIRMIDYHLEVATLNQRLLAELHQHFADDSTVFKQVEDYLVAADTGTLAVGRYVRLNSLLQKSNRLCAFFAKIDTIGTLNPMPQRYATWLHLSAELDNIQALFEQDFHTGFARIEGLESELNTWLRINLYCNKLLAACPPKLHNQMCAELDNLYLAPVNFTDNTAFKIDQLVEAFKKYKQITRIRSDMSMFGVDFTKDAHLIEEIESLETQSTLQYADVYFDVANNFLNLFNELYSLMHKFEELTVYDDIKNINRLIVFNALYHQFKTTITTLPSYNLAERIIRYKRLIHYVSTIDAHLPYFSQLVHFVYSLIEKNTDRTSSTLLEDVMASFSGLNALLLSDFDLAIQLDADLDKYRLNADTALLKQLEHSFWDFLQIAGKYSHSEARTKLLDLLERLEQTAPPKHKSLSSSSFTFFANSALQDLVNSDKGYQSSSP